MSFAEWPHVKGSNQTRKKLRICICSIQILASHLTNDAFCSQASPKLTQMHQKKFNICHPIVKTWVGRTGVESDMPPTLFSKKCKWSNITNRRKLFVNYKLRADGVFGFGCRWLFLDNNRMGRGKVLAGERIIISYCHFSRLLKVVTRRISDTWSWEDP